MGKETLNKELTVKISEIDFAALNLLSKKMEIPINDVVRGLIPRFSYAKASEATTLTIPAEPNPKTGPFKIQKNLDKKRLREICDELIDNRMAKTLGDQIKQEVIVENREILNVTTEKRLLRWTHPARDDNRTRFAKPKAEEMCMMLFGFTPERED